jgi:glycosyltransferase involved in cell wall biosynthesis
LGLADKVVVPGWIDAARRQELLEQSDIFLLPSHAEGLPMSLLEAMAAGLPVLCSTAGGIPLAVTQEKEGLLVEPGDVVGLRNALTRMIQEPELRAKCGKVAHERAIRDFSVQNRVEQLTGIYQAYGVVTLS